MSAREWKPGDVAMVAAYNRPQPYRAYFDGKTWREYGADMFCVNAPTDVRPLIVIDAEDREQVERLLRGYSGWGNRDNADGIEHYPEYVADMQAALREFANPTPPKPEVYEHLAVHTEAGGLLALCGKVWKPNRAGVTVVGKCPECADAAAEGWVA